jgi:hypothetical protein
MFRTMIGIVIYHRHKSLSLYLSIYILLYRSANLISERRINVRDKNTIIFPRISIKSIVIMLKAFHMKVTGMN